MVIIGAINAPHHAQKFGPDHKTRDCRGRVSRKGGGKGSKGGSSGSGTGSNQATTTTPNQTPTQTPTKAQVKKAAAEAAETEAAEKKAKEEKAQAKAKQKQAKAETKAAAAAATATVSAAPAAPAQAQVMSRDELKAYLKRVAMLQASKCVVVSQGVIRMRSLSVKTAEETNGQVLEQVQPTSQPESAMALEDAGG